ncbi:MAG TPA: outer membrane beta-barrel family protein [Gillisia sp.]|nr:outer membrane beta-barrel family protein [Gillisia sp.]
MKINYFVPLFFLIFLTSFQAYSQYSIKGIVKDQSSNPVVFANVVLLNSQDSTTVYRGAVSNEEGEYTFENIAQNEYLLSISFVGFQNFLKKVEINGDENLGTIVLEEEASGLQEITINAKKPKISRSIDRIIFDVENSTLSNGNSWDILKKTPGVIVTQNQLLVRNNVVAVYINDKKVHLSSSELQALLESYSAANIKSIEVITNPPARYEAEGGAILNIITSTNLTPGYKGNINGNYTQAIYTKYQFGTSHYFKSEKLNVFANYSISPRKEFKNDDSHINFMSPNGDIFSRWTTDFNRTTTSLAHNANLNLDYNIDARNSLSFSANAMLSPNKKFDNTVETHIRNAQFQLDSSFVTRSGLVNDEENIALNLNYTHKLKKEGAQVSSTVHYTNFGQDRTQDVFSTYFSPQQEVLNRISFMTDAAQNIDIFTAQVDYETPLGSTSFELGAKASFIDSESGIDYYNTPNNAREYIAALSDNFLYDEKIYAGYTSITKEWEKWAIKGGLRAEYTDILGVSNSMGEVNTQDYFELFPTAYFQHTLNEDHVLTFDYARRIARPRYESLNPFRYFLNENNFNTGNPDLKAAITNNFNLNYTLKGQYFFDLYYQDNGITPSILAFQDNENLNIRSIGANLVNSKAYGLDISHSRSITKFWYAQLFTSLFHDENTFLAVESGDREVTNEVNGIQAYIYNVFTLSKDGTFEGNLFLMHVSDYIAGSYQLDPMTTFSIGFRKTLWDNRAELTLNIEDIINTTNSRLVSRYLNQDNSFLAQEETRYVRVGFKYNFGNFRLSDNQRKIEAAERDRI